MRVLISPQADRTLAPEAVDVARALAGSEGQVIHLWQVGVRNLSRNLTPAEVSLLRGALLGSPADGRTDRDQIVGFVCQGVGLGEWAGKRGVVVPTDHANLTWRSPLRGPNDDAVGPRFPNMDNVYAPDVALQLLSACAADMIVFAGTVAGVTNEISLTPFEKAVTKAQQHTAASSELVPVAIVAAHIGLRVAAAVVLSTNQQEGEVESG
ncbi:MAG: hypothetical protein N3B14_01525 [Thermoleophilia bacterium]|nr:hypothetical protein [Thermoleophilia bacterium]